VNDLQKRMVATLRTDGVVTVDFRELFGEALWAEVEADVAPFIREIEEVVGSQTARLEQKKYLLRRYWSKKRAKNHRFSPEDVWLRVFASDLLLMVVNTYREERTKLYYVDNWYTVPFPDSDERLASQRWHRDPEDEHVVKAFVYLSDVDEGAGPFEYVRGSTHGGRYGDLWPWETGVLYPPPGELEGAVAADDRLLLAGPAGTLILADTGGFHRGGYSRTGPRISATCTYVPAGAMPDRRFEVELGAQSGTLSEEALYALDW
jgi:hypothetical protein